MKLLGIKDYSGYACIIDFDDIESITPFIERYSPTDAVVNGYSICFKNSGMRIRISEEQFYALLDIVDKI